MRASGDRDETGSYTLSVRDVTPVIDPPADTPDVAPGEPGPDLDALRAAATDFGDITDVSSPLFPRGTLDVTADAVNYYRFTLTEAKQVGLALRGQDADADLVLEDEHGTELHSSERSGTTREWIQETLLAGTYYVRVEAQETGANTYVLRYAARDPDPAEVARLRAEQGQASEPEETATQESQETPSVSEGDTDLPAGYSTPGRVVVGESVTGQIGSPGDRDGFFVDLEAGETYRIRLDGAARELWSVDDPNGDHVVTRGWAVHFFTAEITGAYHIEVGGDRNSQGGAYTLSVAEVGESLANDYANDPQTTGSVAVGGSVFGNRNHANDQDWFAVDLDAGRTYWIDLEGAFTVGSLLDPQIFGIHDSDGNINSRHDGPRRGLPHQQPGDLHARTRAPPTTSRPAGTATERK